MKKLGIYLPVGNILGMVQCSLVCLSTSGDHGTLVAERCRQPGGRGWDVIVGEVLGRGSELKL